MRTLLAAAACLASIAVTSAAHAADHYRNAPYRHDGLTLEVKDISFSAKKIWFKVTFLNESDQTMVVDADRLRLSLPDGRTLARVKGVFDGVSHGTKAIPAGGSQAVAFEFLVGEAPPEVSLDLSGVLVGSKPFRGPALVAKLGEPSWSAATYEHKGIGVTLRSGKQSGDEAELELTIANASDTPIFVDLDAFLVALPNGTKVTREKGLKDRFKGAKSVVEAKRSTDIDLTFKVGHPQKIALELGINEGALGLPPVPFVLQ